MYDAILLIKVNQKEIDEYNTKQLEVDLVNVDYNIETVIKLIISIRGKERLGRKNIHIRWKY